MNYHKVLDKESFQVGEKWFKPNYHAHVVFDWMNHETGKSRKLNDEDMAAMQTLASDILMMERGQSKNVTGILTLQYWNFFKILCPQGFRTDPKITDQCIVARQFS